MTDEPTQRQPAPTLASPALRWGVGGFLGGAGLVGLLWSMIALGPHRAPQALSQPAPQTATRLPVPASTPTTTPPTTPPTTPTTEPVATASPPDSAVTAIAPTERELAATIAVSTDPEPAATTPTVVEAPPAVPGRAATTQAPASPIAIRINVNTASLAELDELPGIGPALGGRIIESRSADGPFRSLQDLTRVRGIGEKTAEKLAPYVRFN